MTTALAAPPAPQLTDSQFPVDRVSLADLAALGTDELATLLHRALPDAALGRVAVAAFQSSI
ncbi:hypothetical protein GCM10009760_22840 [Kitasatospora kazusensis]|uniref:FXSXX-COOH protein n=1 Tax=Kitasatospora kazusensis TaxID=407974 RepID=A0ABP5L0E7_9ACTN